MSHFHNTKIGVKFHSNNAWWLPFLINCPKKTKLATWHLDRRCVSVFKRFCCFYSDFVWNFYIFMFYNECDANDVLHYKVSTHRVNHWIHCFIFYWFFMSFSFCFAILSAALKWTRLICCCLCLLCSTHIYIHRLKLITTDNHFW